jgi:hypothetical protein
MTGDGDHPDGGPEVDRHLAVALRIISLLRKYEAPEADRTDR